jgi:hypothetical protein
MEQTDLITILSNATQTNTDEKISCGGNLIMSSFFGENG